MEELLYKILAAVLVAVLPILTGFVCNLLRKAADEIKLRAKTERERALVEEINNAVDSAVKYVNQTFVDELKKSNLWNGSEEYAEAAFNEAFQKTIEIISAEATDYILDTFGDVRSYLEVKIEENVRGDKEFAGWNH